jgi:hypothetical protein
MEIEAHEFEPRPYSSLLCNECEYGKQHPLHSLARVLTGQKPVWVNVEQKSDTRRECQHESFECSGPTPTVRHCCTDCRLCWTDNGTSLAAFVYCDICRPPKQEFVTKDSGKRESYDSGMVRDTQDDKPRFDLLLPVGVPYGDQFLTRVAGLLARGAEKYSERNWEKAEGEAELTRFRASALRHLLQYLAGETDEDHMAAVVFNLMGAHLVEWKMRDDESG